MKDPIWVYDPLHRQNFYFFLNYSHKAVVSWIQETWHVDYEPDPQASGTTFSVPHPHGGFVIGVWCPGFKKNNPQSMEVLVHEICHAAWYSLGPRGYLPTTNDHEEFCYLQGFLIREVWLKLK